MNLQEHIRRILREEDFIPLESLNTVIKDYEDGFDVFIMNKDKKIGGISFVKDDLPNAYTIVDATIDDEYKGNRIYPKTIINLFKERPNIIINSVFRSPEAEKSWRHLLSDLPPNIVKSVKHYKEEETTLYQLKLKNLQEQISRMKSMMGVISESLDVTDIEYDGVLFDYHKKHNLQHHSKNGNNKNLDDFKRHFIDEIKKYIVEDNEILLYRLIAANDESQIRKPFGIYWSFKKEDSQVINWEEIDEPENLNVYRITALFDIKDIDLKNSFDLYLTNDFMESEIRIKKGVMPQDYFIEKI